MYERVVICKDEGFYREWGAEHAYCHVCGISESQARRIWWPGLSSHHIVKAGRSHEACNLLRLCDLHHRLAEGAQVREGGELLPKLTLAICLTVKMIRDPGAWNPERLTQLFRRNLPDLEPIPPVFESEYRMRRWRDTQFFFHLVERKEGV